MFAPLGLFRDIPCPQGQECTLLTCIFSHDLGTSTAHDEVNYALEEKPAKIETPASPSPVVRKKIKLERNSEVRQQQQQQQQHGEASSSTAPSSPLSHTPDATTTSSPASEDTQQNGHILRKTAPKESLNPRMIPKAPAPHATRSTILTKLHEAMSAQNRKVKIDKEVKRYLVLSPNELVIMALDEEEKVAKENANIYSNVIKNRIVRFMKMTKEEWIQEVIDHLNARYYRNSKQYQKLKKKTKGDPLATGLSVSDELALVGKLLTPLKGLEEFGYVTRVPTEAEIQVARKGVAESRGWEKCDRCAGRFQVFPGRRGDGTLTTGGPCTYHPGKAVSPPRKPTDHITGQGDAFHLCCNETVGASAGCVKAPTHVFKVSETKRLASILQFQETPLRQPNDEKERRQPISFDCEMGYTTLGLELIRLTIVSWPEGKQLLDVLVKPMGEVLDLNSAYSGVFPEHYIKAVPYGTTATTTTAAAAAAQATSTANQPHPSEVPVMQVVESPAEARILLFQFLDPGTPLIGHSIDSDLNACRVIHPTVVDTVILYPHPGGGLPSRSALKVLARKFLDRDVQTGGAHGHDSKEDAITAGDLVRVKAAGSWKILKAKGWLIQDGKLIAPPGASDDVLLAAHKKNRKQRR